MREIRVRYVITAVFRTFIVGELRGINKLKDAVLIELYGTRLYIFRKSQVKNISEKMYKD